jgi:hypothetical protein
MTKRRETFLLVPKPGKSDEAQDTLASWLREIEGNDGYLGGAVLKESANELLPDTFVLTLDFESTDQARAFRKSIGDGVNPITQDDKETKSKDQGAVIFAKDSPSAPSLSYEKGGGMFAQLLHVHAHILDEYRVSGE